jgi:hypothetical protein
VFLGRYAWRGFVFAPDRDGILFYGWLLDPDFTAGSSGPFSGYGFRPGFASRGPVKVGPGLPKPLLPAEIDPIVDEMLARGASAPRLVETREGPFELVACYDDPQKKPVWVEVEAKAGRGLASMRVFKR